jgi:hypothetical protein
MGPRQRSIGYGSTPVTDKVFTCQWFGMAVQYVSTDDLYVTKLDSPGVQR